MHMWGWFSRTAVRKGALFAMSFTLITLASVPAFAQSIRWFPEINPSDPSSGSLAWDISADGQVLVGTLRTSAGFRPFRWVREGGYQNLFAGVLNVEGGAFAISDSGQVVVGFAGRRAFRWTESGGLELLPPALLDAHDVSADGSVIVGTGVNGAARLTPNGIQTIAQQGAVPWGVSADGTAVAGGVNLGGLLAAFRWTESGGLQLLNRFAFSYAWDISADGSTVVGFYAGAGGSGAFRWRPDQNEFTDLGSLGGGDSIAFGVNDDGLAVFGWSRRPDGRYRAFIWTEAEGMRDLNEVFAEVVSDGSVLLNVRAVSQDGRYLVGWGDRPNRRREAFVLDTWRFGAARRGNCIDNDDLLAVLFAFGTPGTGYTRHEDINKDGIVNNDDLLIVLFNFGQGCQ